MACSPGLSRADGLLRLLRFVGFRFAHDALHILNHLARRSVAFHLEAIFWSVDRARGADQFLSPCALANIRRAKIERIAGGVNLDGVEKLAAKYFDTSNHVVSRGEKFLNQRDLIDSKIKLIFFDRALQLFGPVEANDPCAAAANVWLYHQRIADSLRGRQGLRGMIYHQRLWIGQAERFEQGEL